ncbi:hypothetical protein AB0M23_21660 [Streptomyces sp. NPDC052077]|uniref:hypothetical protein n=1 Tax=Streptomyces sp. NPDC052077 TaxID=3154757 RepID=UPI003419C195
MPQRLADPAIVQAVERQNRALRELSRQAFPEPDAVDGTPTRLQRRRQADVSRAAALRRARAERAETTGMPPTGRTAGAA